MSNVVPFAKAPPTAREMIAQLSADTENIVVIAHAAKRAEQRKKTGRQIELCVQRGVIIEGPFTNSHGHLQVTLQRHAAGEEMKCVVAIDWPSRLLVITTF